MFDDYDFYNDLFGGDVSGGADAAVPQTADGMTDMTGFKTGGNAASYFPTDVSNGYAYDAIPGLAGTDDESIAALLGTDQPLGSGMGMDFSKIEAPSSSSTDNGVPEWLSKIGEKLFNPKDPLSSAANIVGALAAIRNMTVGAPSDLPKVDALFKSGSSSPYSKAAVIQAKAPAVGRNAGAFVGMPAGALSLIKRV